LAAMGDVDRARLSRGGLLPLSTEQGLEIFDRARSGSEPFALAAALDRRALGTLARAGVLPAILSGLAGGVSRRRSKAAAGSFARHLATVSEADREATVLALVREHVATVLGHASADAIEEDQPLLELGLDSLGAVELRNRLAHAAGVQLPTTVVFDHPTSAELARHLSLSLEEGTDGGVAVNGDMAGTGGATLRTLLTNAHNQGNAHEVLPLLVEASRFHPVFRSVDEFKRPRAMQLSRSGTAPRIICVPSFVVGSGPHQFVKIARALEGRRAVTSLSLPGAGQGRLLPATWSAAVDVLAASAREAAGDDSFVIVGYSSGGVIAHALVERLESEDMAPAALITIDSQVPGNERSAEIFATIMGTLIEMDHEAIAIDDDHLMTMGAYIRLLAEWQQGSIETPELSLRASEGLGAGSEEDRPSTERLRHETVEVPGDHFALIADNADTTANAIDTWMAEQFEREALGSR
ncbi:MAG TPA: alpha/beta fold hydrolase, partial [Solirubrobacterales bacterium]